MVVNVLGHHPNATLHEVYAERLLDKITEASDQSSGIPSQPKGQLIAPIGERYIFRKM
jgi:hypothetical protein